jgi:hypothetical protein
LAAASTTVAASGQPQREIVIGEQAPPRCHDHADCVLEGLGVGERPVELVEEFGESDIDRFGYELCLAAREEAPERAARPAGVSDDLAEPRSS